MFIKRIIGIVTVTVTILLSAASITIAQNIDNASANVATFDYSQVVIALEQSGLQYQKPSQSDPKAPTWLIDVPISKDQTRRFLIRGFGDTILILDPLLEKPESITEEFKDKVVDINNILTLSRIMFDNQFIYLRIDALVYNLNGPVLTNYLARLLKAETELKSDIAAAAGINLEDISPEATPE